MHAVYSVLQKGVHVVWFSRVVLDTLLLKCNCYNVNIMIVRVSVYKVHVLGENLLHINISHAGENVVTGNNNM